MSQSLKAIGIALGGAILLSIVLTIVGVPHWPMLIACEVMLVGLYSLFYWKPTILRDVVQKLIEKVRMWA